MPFRLTVITSTYNCGAALRKTARSIRSLPFPVQWIIADGGSTDETITIIEDNNDIVSHWFSEKDKGIYDAWNKAWAKVQGDWVVFLGAGDEFFDSYNISGFLSEIDEHVKDNDTVYSIAYGNVAIVNVDGELRYIRRDKVISIDGPGFPNLPCHQGVFHNVSLVNSLGSCPFDDSYKIAADGKLMIALLRLAPPLHIDSIITKMSDDGVSSDHRNFFLLRAEVVRFCNEMDVRVLMLKRISSFIKPFILWCIYKIIPLSLKKNVDNFLDLRRYRG